MIKKHWRGVLLIMIGLALLGWLLFYRLGLLTGGVSSGEVAVAHSAVGWHGLYYHPLDLPMQFVRSVVYYFFPQHGAFLIRLPSVFFGLLAILAMTIVLKLWYGNRTALFGAALFGTSAWTLHVSRLAGNNSVYLLAIPLLLAGNVILQRFVESRLVFWGVLFGWSMLATVPGLIWLVIWSVAWQRQSLREAWDNLSSNWEKFIGVLLAIIWLPVVGLDVWHNHRDWITWLGAPNHLAAPLNLAKQLGLVFEHLFVRGPSQPDLWLGRVPLLDAFTFACCLIGIYFYVLKFKAGRSQMLAGYLLLGAILVALGGPVLLSVLVPLLYILAATGITYLLRKWLAVFPINPIARSVGIGLIAVAVVIASVYNLRAYFVAWPHNLETKATFTKHL